MLCIYLLVVLQRTLHYQIECCHLINGGLKRKLSQLAN